MTLGDFLAAARNERGPWNCSTFPADWCVSLGLPDFAAKWRAVIDPAECEEVAGGDLVALWEEGIGDALPQADLPYQAGDIGVIRIAGQLAGGAPAVIEAGAVFTGDKWAVRKERGLSLARLPDSVIAKAWRTTDA